MTVLRGDVMEAITYSNWILSDLEDQKRKNSLHANASQIHEICRSSKKSETIVLGYFGNILVSF